MNETAEKGQIVVLRSVGAGAAMDQGKALVTVAAANTTNIVAGVLLNDVVDLDLTRQHINFHKDEVQKGGKVSLLKKGYIVTDQVALTGSYVAGALAFMDDDDTGLIVNAAHVDDGEYTAIGRFMSDKDEDGYYKVEINLPIPIDNTVAGALNK